ncbi:aconitate hydratase AcnA [candidate division BRC1 bacterium HGW-BRC1-1]|jgi:aconitate hydratase|nr:MAG: aconitate hydratase AcnA [candidate division BRC1 bacterium HGW-BRC1-1]
MKSADSNATRTTLESNGKSYEIFSLLKLSPADFPSAAKLPFSLRVLLENLLRLDDGSDYSTQCIRALATWNPKAKPDQEIGFTVARVLLQDFTGVPCVVDLAAMRDAMAEMGGDPSRINPLQGVDLVIDHSVQIDYFGSPDAQALNARLEYERNSERYQFLRWGSNSFDNFRVVPPDTGIVHQVNLEYLASVVYSKEVDGTLQAYPDTLVGTDSHTPMVNGMGVLGWGVGGIEAEAAMLGQPISMLIPEVVGVRLTGRLQPGSTATDMVLTITEVLRKKGVVGKIVEYFGDALAHMSVADRATIANMSPEYGATAGFFPVDNRTLEYLRLTGRTSEQVTLVEDYCRAQGLFRTEETEEPIFSEVVEIDLSSVRPSLAGPRRPQDRILLDETKPSYRKALVELLEAKEKLPETQKTAWLAGEELPEDSTLAKSIHVSAGGQSFDMTHGAVVIASITSCTNTSNPTVLIAAGLLARKAVARGMKVKPWVKTSLAPGSQVVTEYLNESGLMGDLEKLGFHVVGYGCATCIGNSGPLPQPIADAVTEGDLVAAAVLSGNRNFEGRINPLVRANYLASPPLVVAYALAGSMDLDMANGVIGLDSEGRDVRLSEIWPSEEEVANLVQSSVSSAMFRKVYGNVFQGDEAWSNLPVPTGEIYTWNESSTYIKRPPFFENLSPKPTDPQDIESGKVLAMLGDSVTTDHISPAGSIGKNSPAARYLMEHDVQPHEFNSYGSRRGNHEVMMRGTFANIRLRNQLAPGTEGGVTVYQLTGEQMSIYDAAMKYRALGTPLLILAGQEYGSGSSRDWAAKGTSLLGVHAVLAQSYERIHRSNLIGMGVLPLQFESGASRETLGLTGFETFAIRGISEGITPGKKLQVFATAQDGSRTTEFSVLCRIDTPNEIEYYRHGGILQYVLRQMVKSAE